MDYFEKNDGQLGFGPARPEDFENILPSKEEKKDQEALGEFDELDKKIFGAINTARSACDFLKSSRGLDIEKIFEFESRIGILYSRFLDQKKEEQKNKERSERDRQHESIKKLFEEVYRKDREDREKYLKEAEELIAEIQKI